MDEMERMIASREPGYVCAVPVHSLMVSRHDEGMRAALRGATMNVPDGRPLVWALNLLGEQLPDRVYGPDLMDRFCARAARRGHRIWLYGGATQEALDELVRALESPPPGPADRRELVAAPPAADLRGGARRGQADRRRPGGRGVGGARRPEAGAVDGAHAARGCRRRCWSGWERRSTSCRGASARPRHGCRPRGLEWLFRLSQEPLRLLPRYLRYNPAFIAAFARQYGCGNEG